MAESNRAKTQSTENDLGELIEGFQVGQVVRWTLALPAAFFLLTWVVLVSSGFIMLIRGEVEILGLLFGVVPWTLLTAGFVYSASYLWFYQLAVCRHGLRYRTLHQNQIWKFRELLDVRVETIEKKSLQGQKKTVTVLFIMPQNPQTAPVRINTMLNNRPIFSTAVKAWRNAINVR